MNERKKLKDKIAGILIAVLLTAVAVALISAPFLGTDDDARELQTIFLTR